MSLLVREAFAPPAEILKEKRERRPPRARLGERRRTHPRLTGDQEARIRRTAAWWARLHARWERAKARQETLAALAGDSDGDSRGTTKEKVAYHRARMHYEGVDHPLQDELMVAWDTMIKTLREVGARIAIVDGMVFHAWDPFAANSDTEFENLFLTGLRADTAVLNLDADRIGGSR